MLSFWRVPFLGLVSSSFLQGNSLVFGLPCWTERYARKPRHGVVVPMDGGNVASKPETPK